MTAKITVPKEVADAIAYFVDLADTKTEAFTDILSMGYEGTHSEIILCYFAGNNDELMEALICGYEVEASPEDNLRKYYEEAQYKRLSGAYTQTSYGRGVTDGIERTLEYLGMKVEGINA
jgi:hypothetical protein